MYSWPTRTTLAAFTMASAASMEPTRPRVSTIPSASIDMAGTIARQSELPEGSREREAPMDPFLSREASSSEPVARIDTNCPFPASSKGFGRSRPDLHSQSRGEMMKLSRSWGLAVTAALAGSLLLSGCNRRKAAEVNPIKPSVKVNRARAPLGSAIEVTYTWTLEPGAKKLDQDYRALVHFLDSHEVMLFEDDHTPVPPPSSWEPGKSYSYTRTK